MIKPRIAIYISYVLASILFLFIYSHASEKPESFQLNSSQIASDYESGFCGWSTNGECKTDSDCIKGGCSGQVCQSGKEGAVITTCEWRECYNSSKYKVSCMCADNRCKWIKKNESKEDN